MLFKVAAWKVKVTHEMIFSHSLLNLENIFQNACDVSVIDDVYNSEILSLTYFISLLYYIIARNDRLYWCMYFKCVANGA